jgi:SAM-dependent methyltransferase
MPALKALLAQLTGLILTFLLAQQIQPGQWPLWALALTQGVIAAAACVLMQQARWWIPLHLAFVPALVGALALQLPPFLYLGVFLVLLFVYWTTFRTQVPLFLSSRTAVHVLAHQFGTPNGLRVIDLGSGTGSFARYLAKLRPDWQIDGVEMAPAPFLWARWRSRRTHNVRIRRDDIWRQSLGDYDIVYAYLSPAPMLDLWRKARKEMKPGAWLVSNEFPVPGLKADLSLAVNEEKAKRLYCYQIPAGT